MHFAMASFMLALIGLKKFRSFQKPNRIARTLKKRKGPGERTIPNKASRGRPRSGGECRGVAGVRGTAPEPVWGPRGEKRAMENVGSECNFGKQLATRL